LSIGFRDFGCFKLFTRPVRIFNRCTAHQIFHFDSRFGRAPGLFHNGKIQYLVRFPIQFNGHATILQGDDDDDDARGYMKHCFTVRVKGENHHGRSDQQQHTF
jgi:hypothetical protein